MSLSRTIALHVAGLLLGLAALAGVSLWGLAGLHENARLAECEYAELRTIQSAVLHATVARVGLQSGEQDESILAELEARDERLNAVLEDQASDDAERSDRLFDRSAVSGSVSGLREALEELHASKSGANSSVDAFEHVLTHINELAEQMGSLIAAGQAAADQRLHSTTWAIAALSIVILLSLTWIQVSYYRSLVVPLQLLHDGVRHMASRQFRDRLPLQGAREFQSLSIEFNRMAEELDALYTSLEEKVRAKSKALVRSERLASVGFLAAGVAHEINNPLNIISAHAELTLNRLARNENGAPNGELISTLTMICEEAFRCKGITEKLLSLSVSSEGVRQRVSLARIAEEVAAMVACLKQSQDRRVSVRLSGSGELAVMANASELKQVLLNLLVNALQAVEPGCGEVVIRGMADHGRVFLHVEDNGKGMTRDVLENAFEPFFTQRRGSGGQGVGLGLSISHAIVASHGGSLTAQSEGPNRGSCLTIELPQYQEASVNDRHPDKIVS